MIRVAVLGAGWVATHRYLPVLRRHRRAQVVAVFDRHPERAEAAARSHQGALATDDLEQALEAQPDLVVICTSPWSHADLGVAALQAGAHVITEKPMAMNSEEAERMADAAREADRVLVVSHNFLFSRAMRRAERHLGGRRPGHVIGTQLSSDRRRLPDWHEDLPGGLLFDEIPHLLYVTRHLLGDTRFVSAAQSTNETMTVTEIDLEGAHLSVVSGAPVSEWHITAIGDDGLVDLDLFRDIALRLPSDGAHSARDILGTSARGILGHVGGFVGSGLRLIRRRLYWGHDVLIDRVVEAVADSGAPPVSIDDAVAVVHLTDQILGAIDAAQ